MNKRIAVFEELIHQVQGNKPQPGCPGIYSYCDVNVPCGGGQGGFFWFKDDAEFFELAKYFCFMYADSDEDCDDELFRRNNEIITSLQSKKVDLETARLKLNELLKGRVQTSWWGPFDNLLDGQGKFARETRTLFWAEQPDADEENEIEDPIPEKLVGQFRDWIAEYV
jgi:hypothetical protein